MSESEFETLRRSITECRQCPRLVEWREAVASEKRAAFRDETYWGRPVPMFGGDDAGVLVVGLAPAAHGANRTGRMFTGDRSGDWLYRAMHRAGFATQAEATAIDDGLEPVGATVTSIVKCAPPDNKPTAEEQNLCRSWLEHELDAMADLRVVIALGGLAFTQVLRLGSVRGWDVPRPRPKFGHGQEVDLGDGAPRLIASYHPSQQNTFTGRLTEAMLDDVFGRARRLVDAT